MRGNPKLSCFWVPVILCSAHIAGICHAQEVMYPVAAIPGVMLENAGAIVRKSHTTYEISSSKQLIKRRHYVVTILNEQALQAANLILNYDKFTRITRIKGYVYNAEGVLQQKIPESDFADRSALPEGTFHSDDRCKAFRPVFSGNYPVTYEWDYEIIWETPAIYPTWAPQSGYNISIEQASLVIISEESLLPKFKAVNCTSLPLVIQEGSRVSVTWEFDSIPAVDDEPYSPQLEETVPMLLLAPAENTHAGYSGSFKTWDDIGNWMNFLGSDRLYLPETTREKVRALVQDQQDTLEIIRTVYSYVQSKTRYVSVQLGIGGWQPVEAAFVDANGYGDCKGLVNYVRAILKSLGIDSYYTLVAAGSRQPDIQTDFPSNQFNHVILCIPLKSDTIWLECTDPNQPFGFLGSFTRNRHVLIVTPGGGKLAKTPDYPGAVNRLDRKMVVDLFVNGDAILDITTTYTGLQYETVENILNIGPEEQKKAHAAGLGIPNIEVRTVGYDVRPDTIPRVTERILVHARSYASVSGERLFVPLNMINRISAVTGNTAERKLPVVTGYPYIDTDSVVFRYPAGYQTESLPDPVSIESPYGSYRFTVTSGEGELVYCRYNMQEEIRSPANAFNDFRVYMNTLSRADKGKAVLRKTGE